MPPAAKNNRLDMFIAKINGILSELFKKTKFRLTGEKLASASAGFPTLKCHHGTNRLTAINSKVAAPPAIPSQFILLFILFALPHWDAADGKGLIPLYGDAVHVHCHVHQFNDD